MSAVPVVQLINSFESTTTALNISVHKQTVSHSYNPPSTDSTLHSPPTKLFKGTSSVYILDLPFNSSLSEMKGCFLYVCMNMYVCVYMLVSHHGRGCLLHAAQDKTLAVLPNLVLPITQPVHQSWQHCRQRWRSGH